MKKVILLLATCAFTTVSFAQTTPTTEVKVRDNGTKKVVTKTGKTNVGQALENTADAAGNLVSDAGDAISGGAKKSKHAVKKTSLKASRKLKRGTKTLEKKTE